MMKQHWSEKRVAALAVGTVFAVLIGCGGGGGGGGTTGSTSTTSGSTSTTSGSTSTTSGSTSTTSGSTSTTSGSTSTTSGSTSTTSGSTSTTSGSTSTTSGGTGLLPADRIIYSSVSTSNVAQLRTVAPDGTSNQVFASFADDTVEAIRNPNTAEWIYAASPAALLGRFQLFRGPSFNVSSSSNTLVTSVDFESLQDIGISPNNATIYFVGATSADDSLKVYSVPRAGGTPSVLDFGRELTVSPTGNKIAYVKDNAGGTAADIYIRDLSAGTVVKVTSTSGEYAYPSFNRAGDRLVYALDDGTSWDIYSIPAAGGSATRLTNTSALDEYGAYYNSDGTKLTFARIGVAAGETGVFVANANGSSITQIVTDETTGPRVYWTTPGGRSFGGVPIRFEKPGREKRRK